jgi:hypothetical protein
MLVIAAVTILAYGPDVLVLLSPLAPWVARRLGKDPSRTASAFASFDVAMLLLRGLIPALEYFIAPAGGRSGAWLIVVRCVVFGAAAFGTRAVGQRLARTAG